MLVRLVMRHLKSAACLLIVLSAVSISAYAQNSERHINVTIKPAQTVEQRVADSIKEKELREAAEEKVAAEKSARIAANSPRALLSRAQTVFVQSSTSYFEPIQLQNGLRKRSEFEAWQMVMIDSYKKREVADIIIDIDRPYKITDRENGIVLATGKITAFDGNAAAPLLTGRIIEDIKKARGEDTKK